VVNYIKRLSWQWLLAKKVGAPLMVYEWDSNLVNSMFRYCLLLVSFSVWVLWLVSTSCTLSFLVNLVLFVLCFTIFLIEIIPLQLKKIENFYLKKASKQTNQQTISKNLQNFY
jgi:hypothetical protein